MQQTDPITETRVMRTLDYSGNDVLADRPRAGSQWDRIVRKRMIGRVVPAAFQAVTEGVP